MSTTEPEDYQATTIAAYDNDYQRFVTNTRQLILRKEMHNLIEYAHLREGDEVLDAGCAHGKDMEEFLKYGLKMTGIDRSIEFIKVGKELLGERATLLQMDMRYPRFAENTFSAIWANASLLHLTEEDMVITLRNWKMILKPGGVVMASMKKGEGSKTFAEKSTIASERFYTFMEEERMREIIIESGLTPIDFYYENESDKFPGIGRDIDWLYSFFKKA